MGGSPLQSRDEEPGMLYIIGAGPGDVAHMTAHAREALGRSEYVVGNETYLKPIAALLEGKQVIRSRMGDEVGRAEKSVALAEHSVVAIVSGGDPGVYGMASLVIEVLERSGLELQVEVIPGVTAANAAAARLGAPLSGDFAVVSLSDLLTPWDVIQRRLDAIFSAGIPVVIYNPRSRGRPHHFMEAVKIAKEHLDEATPAAVVKNAYREREEVLITTLGGLEAVEEEIDMHSTVIIGGEDTRYWRIGGHVRGIVTPRGYHRKYAY